MTSTVRQLLLAKGNKVHAISPEATVFEALERMAAHDVGALMVMKDDQLVGIFSERDYARKIILMGRISKDTRVGEVMTSDLITVTPEATVADCMNLMTDHHIRHLPVLEDGKLVGVISIGDVVKAIITQQEFMIAELESYITGSR
ncbi:CBS domain-containing protein [Meiothermus ruber]|jgi:CBS domain-containing protein|uniref:Putative signal transduction protein n=1 Tax=Meiothermus ruber (strain ATCC 35948 / DSM 1279 / VKM B-1258 / 21) TaxID=504728 RepID=D3PQ73_MEIRD|nr:CBS domain-containing protein [Meiothermus ruber]ADD29706.1 putative signal transduction protein with CBS domains [Meiothermus ruber DSM 1279]AGK04838.1 putative signal transduction protein [Meiothermus ruber DSM 1279]MCL6529594.1 CBS domain-containing protein [Meiothermus ruber]GAO76627.1 putative signal transduction protein with CBS domains [Meiothermus ruber H328]